jgi:hypothetical protein
VEEKAAELALVLVLAGQAEVEAEAVKGLLEVETLFSNTHRLSTHCERTQSSSLQVLDFLLALFLLNRRGIFHEPAEKQKRKFNSACIDVCFLRIVGSTFFYVFVEVGCTADKCFHLVHG